MTAATVIGAGIGKTPALGPANQPKAVFGAEQTGLAAQVTLLPAAQGSGSFRAGWQSLLASIGTNLEPLDFKTIPTDQLITSSEANAGKDNGQTFRSCFGTFGIAGFEFEPSDRRERRRLECAGPVVFIDYYVKWECNFARGEICDRFFG